ncbi:MAG TPA: tetratricopeptide repeat protein [Myxococcota bacterium]|nr:tetratricopeptide repeat protein [Myxococcota bacterium]
MAINKRKILEAAQKFLQKGSLDKALKEYQTLLQADPRDSNSRLKLGDIHLKLGQKDEAIAAYLKVAEQFMKDGFDAKAVALYKQITKIDANRSDVQVPLAELYQRLGLTSEAMAALQTAADAYHREGRKRDALELLRKMATLDPTNTTSRMKIAELLRQAGLKDEAIVEYEEVAAELARHDETEGLIQVYERILELDSGRATALVGLARGLIATGQADRAEPFAKRATEVRPDSTDGFELLAESYRAIGRVEELEPLYRKLADLYRMHGDENRAREILQRFVSAEPLQLDESGLQAGPTPQNSEPDVLDDTPLPREEPSDPAAQAKEEDDAIFFETAAPVPQPEVDVEQVLAEASVYLRYGKHDRAIAGLETVLSREPENRAALEKLGEVLSQSGDLARAVAVWTQAAKVAHTEGDSAGVSLLRDRIEDLAPGKAAGIDFGPAELRASSAPAPQVGPRESGEAEPSDPFVDVDVDLHGPEGALGDAAGSNPPADLEIDIGADLLGEDLPPSLDSPEEESSEIAETATADEANLGQGNDTDVAISQETASEEEEEAKAGGSDGSSTTPQQIVEDLEEGEFYFHQGLHDEATEVYKRVLVVAPNHPQALLRLGEIAAARGQDPAAPSASGAAAKVAVTPVTSKRAKLEETDPSLGADNAAWSGKAEQGKPGSKATAQDAALQQADSHEVSVDLSDLMGDEDFEPSSLSSKRTEDSVDLSAPNLGGESSVEEAAEGGAGGGTIGDTDPDLTSAVEDETEPEVPSSSAAASADESPFDLAAELSEVFADDDRRTSSTPGNLDDGFAAVFREFKRGVQRTVSQGDYETHYDLGIAYREMGLLEDAVGEFQLAMESPTRRMDCLHMLGLCAIDLKRSEEAVAHLERALSLPDVPDSQQVALRFDLGRAFAEMGDRVRARTAFETVAALDPEFQDVSDRLADLNEPDSSTSSEDSDATSDLLESLGGEDAAVSPDDESVGASNVSQENFESFDDLIAEAESELEPSTERQADADQASQGRKAPEEKDAEATASSKDAGHAATTSDETPAPPDPHPPAPGPNQSTGPTPPRRRKISFV